jgi:hypothetical protein
MQKRILETHDFCFYLFHNPLNVALISLLPLLRQEKRIALLE